jgi:hypothetical protein
MYNSNTKVNQMKAAQTGLIILAIMIAVVIGIACVIVEIYLLLECGNPETRAKWEARFKMKNCINWIFKICQLPFLIWAIVVSSIVKMYFQDLSTKNCSSSVYNRLLYDLSDQINNYVFEQNRNAVIVFCVMVIVDLTF